MKYIVDRIENNMAVLEDNLTKDMINIPITNLPKDIHDGSILIYKDNKYFLDTDSEIERRKEIEERFRRLRSS